MLEKFYLTFIDISYNSVLLIILVFLARTVLKRMPKFFSYCLWAFVALRLLIPITFGTSFGLSPPSRHAFPHFSVSETFAPDFSPLETAVIALKRALNGDFRVQIISELLKTEDGVITDFVIMDYYAWWEALVYFGQFLWLAGMIIILAIGLVRYLKLRILTAKATGCIENIYISDRIAAPMILGVLEPKIYIPAMYCGNKRKYLTIHAKYHIRRFDPLWKLLAYLMLCLHWFNPLVWVAYRLICLDLEVSCDEAVLEKLDEDQRAEYLDFLNALPTCDKMRPGMLMAFPESDVAKRILHAGKPVKSVKSPALIATAAFCVLIGCFAFDHKSANYGWNVEPVFEDYPFYNSKQSVVFEMKEYPNAVFTYKYVGKELVVQENGEERVIHEGVLYSLHLADLNGDGNRELCYAPNMTEKYTLVRVYDYANDLLYSLEADRRERFYFYQLVSVWGGMSLRAVAQNVDAVHSQGKLTIRNRKLHYYAGFTYQSGKCISPSVDQALLSSLLQDAPQAADLRNTYHEDGSVITGYHRFVSHFISLNRDALPRDIRYTATEVAIPGEAMKEKPEISRYLSLLGELAWSDYRNYVFYHPEKPDELFVCTEYRDCGYRNIADYYNAISAGQTEAHPDTYIIRLDEFGIYGWGSQKNLYPELMNG